MAPRQEILSKENLTVAARQKLIAAGKKRENKSVLQVCSPPSLPHSLTAASVLRERNGNEASLGKPSPGMASSRSRTVPPEGLSRKAESVTSSSSGMSCQELISFVEERGCGRERVRGRRIDGLRQGLRQSSPSSLGSVDNDHRSMRRAEACMHKLESLLSMLPLPHQPTGRAGLGESGHTDTHTNRQKDSS